jgi:inner membrane protein
MSDASIIKRTADAIRGSVTFKLFVIGFLVLVLLIPTVMVQDLIRERQGRKAEAVKEISEKWGAQQVVTGPMLTIPFRRAFTRQDGTRGYDTRYAHFLPKRLDVDGTLTPEIRYRGIYRAVLYNAKLGLRGRFTRPDFAVLDVNEKDVLWDRAFVALGVNDMTGIRDAITVASGDARFAMNPGIETQEVLASGVSTRLTAGLARSREIPFELVLDLNGSERIRFTPVGEVTQARLSSPWKSPSFDGAFLPAEREVGADGFSAQWKVLHLNRNFPQAWIGARTKIEDSAFGVRLFVAADVYQQSTRTAKYAVLFIVLTFTIFFFSEIINRKRLHPIQYLLTGFALTIFYSLLIALSEHIRFGLSYLIAAAAVVGLITAYGHWALANPRLTALIGGLLAILYGYLYIILQLEDYALLMGSIGLFVALTAVMYVTRTIDWYGGEKKAAGNRGK